MRKSLFILIFSLLSNVGFSQSNYLLQLKSGDYTLHENHGRINLEELKENEIIDGKFYRIIQFYEIPGNQQKESLKELGVELLYYLPQHAFLSSLTTTINTNVLLDQGIRSISPLSVNQKLTEELILEDYPSHALNEEGFIDLVLLYYNNLETKNIVRKLSSNKFQVLHQYDFSSQITVRVAIDRIAELAALPFVYFIEPISPEPQPDNYVGANLHRSQMLYSNYQGGRKYDGSGVHIASGDDGAVGPHIDTQGRIDNSNATLDCGGHGDHDAGTILGAGNLNPKYRGGAPGADLLMYANTPSCGGGTPPWTAILDIPTTYTSHDIRLTSHSWSDNCNAGYTSLAVTSDQQIRQYPDLMHVFSAGNSGSSNCGYVSGWGNITGGIKVAKNVITVGAIRYNNNFASYSSKGPTKDGRLKPDLVALGSSVMSTEEDNTYGSRTGTSHSCPMVTGVFAQLIHAYKIKNGGNEPESALIKAALNNSADDLGPAGPDFRFGYGRMNGIGAVKVIEDATYFSDQVNQGDKKQHNINVPANVKQLKVMLYWNDYEGTASASTPLVNNLNLKLTDPASTDYNPWVLDHTANIANLRKLAVRGIDNINNAEQVTIDNPASGTYTIEVDAAQIPQGPQKYYVVYEFVKDEIAVNHPFGGEAFVPGETEYIHWNAFGESGTFSIDFSTNNGASWTNIVSALHDSTSFYPWTVPEVITGQALIRVSRGTKSGTSTANFSIMPVPQNVNIKWACANSFRLDWDAISGVSSYTVYLLGTKYMDSIATVSTNFYVFDQGINSSNNYWVSVKANGTGNAIGRRAIAIKKAPGTFSCPLAIDATIANVFPSGGSLFDCQSSANKVIQVEVENAGLNPISNIPVSYKINSGATVSETLNSTIQPGYTEIYSFSQTADLSATGTYNISTWVDYPSDANSGNDQNNVVVQVVASSIKAIPFTDDLESYTSCSTSGCATACNTLGDWTNESNGTVDDIDWRADKGGTSSGSTGPEVDHTLGTSNGEYLYLEATSCTLQTALLVSPCIDIPSGKAAQLSFWYHMYGVSMGELHVDVMADGVWNNDVMFTISGDQGDQWKLKTVDLSAFSGKKINVRFRGITGSDYQSDMAIDDISITDATLLNQNYQSPFIVKVFPNPSTSIFNYQIDNANGETVSIEIHDLQGRVIFRYHAKDTKLHGDRKSVV